MQSSVSKSAKTEVVFCASAQPDQGEPVIRLSGVSAELLSRPEQIRKIMELLELPEGAVARIIHVTEDVIVR